MASILSSISIASLRPSAPSTSTTMSDSPCAGWVKECQALRNVGSWSLVPQLVRKTNNGNCYRLVALQSGANRYLVLRQPQVFVFHRDFVHLVCWGLRHRFVSFSTGTLHPFVADIKEPAWTTLVCLGSRLALDVSAYQPMYSLNQEHEDGGFV